MFTLGNTHFVPVGLHHSSDLKERKSDWGWVVPFTIGNIIRSIIPYLRVRNCLRVEKLSAWNRPPSKISGKCHKILQGHYSSFSYNFTQGAVHRSVNQKMVTCFSNPKSHLEKKTILAAIYLQFLSTFKPADADIFAHQSCHSSYFYVAV